jgi:hypothetical protein
MKKTILTKYLAVALAAGLTSFAGSARAALVLSINDSNPSNVIFTATRGATGATGTFSGSSFTAQNAAQVSRQIVDSYGVVNFFTSATGMNNGVAWVATGNLTDNTRDSLSMAINLGGPSLSFVAPTGTINEFSGTAFKGSAHLDLSAFAYLLPSNGFSGTVSFGRPPAGPNQSVPIVGTWEIDNPVAVPVAAPSDVAAVPEPSQVATSLLLVACIAGFVIVKRRKEASEDLAA